MNLPEFDRPPVTEVAIGVQFGTIQGLRQPHFGLFWSRLRDEYPQVQDQPPLPHQPLVGAQPRSFQIELSGLTFPTPRSWFISSQGDHLVQLQSDRLVFNWRGEGERYPRYDSLRPRFDAVWGQWCEFLEEAQLGRAVPEQIELAYVNQIQARRVGDVLAGVDLPALHAAGTVQQEHFLTSQGMPERDDGASVLNVEAANLQGIDRETVVLNLTYRADVADGTSMSALFDEARESIVVSFANITRSEWHETWGRRS